MFGVIGSGPNSKKSILFDREQGVIELLVCKFTLISACLLLILVALWDWLPGAPTHKLRPYKHLWRTLDFAIRNLLTHIVCHFETCVFMWYLVLLPTFVTYTSHPVQQASLNPAVNCEYSKFPVATTLSKHLFSIKPVTNIKEYCEQINLNLPKIESDWLLYWCSHSVSASPLPQSQST